MFPPEGILQHTVGKENIINKLLVKILTLNNVLGKMENNVALAYARGEAMPKRNYLIQLRKQRGWTQEFVAKKLGITTSFYGMIEQGVRTPKLPLAIHMEKLFRKPVSELFSDIKSNIVLGSIDAECLDTKATGTE